MRNNDMRRTIAGKDIKGVNLGGWLLMEGYILHGRNIAENTFKREFRKTYGARGLAEFERRYRAAFITEEDIANIAAMGAKTVRVPFNYRLVESAPFRHDAPGIAFLGKVLDWSANYGLGVILDLHAACGAQNHDWHGDSSGEALFWEKERYRERTTALWEAVVTRFRSHPAVLGYDLLNEPVLPAEKTGILKTFYRDTIRRIKAIDPHHLMFIEGNTWAQQIDFLADVIEDNVWISIHCYAPLAYTFNFEPFLRFPGTVEGERWDGAKLRKYLEPYYFYSVKNNVSIYVGEFGINWRGGCFGEHRWLDGILRAFDDFGFGYTYWTYKAVANSVFPDGLYQFRPNSNYVKREGPVFGFENYLPHWEKEKEQIVEFWKTTGYAPNKTLIDVLAKHFRKKR